MPADGQITSARDLAILARALIHDFPEYDSYWHIPAIKFGRRVMRNTNSLIGRYPGIDGMKTGFICASGFNVVATATRNGRRLIAVVLGAPSSAARAVKAAELLEGGFTQNRAVVAHAVARNGRVACADQAAPPNLHEEICGPHRKKPAVEEEEAAGSEENSGTEAGTPFSVLLSSLRAPTPKGAALLSDRRRRGADRRLYRPDTYPGSDRHAECDRGSGACITRKKAPKRPPSPDGMPTEAIDTNSTRGKSDGPEGDGRQQAESQMDADVIVDAGDDSAFRIGNQARSRNAEEKAEQSRQNRSGSQAGAGAIASNPAFNLPTWLRAER